jgi:hypothetical protein
MRGSGCVYKWLLTTWMVAMEHDVEAESKGDNEEGVPEQELEEGADHSEEHDDVGAEAGVLAH